MRYPQLWWRHIMIYIHIMNMRSHEKFSSWYTSLISYVLHCCNILSWIPFRGRVFLRLSVIKTCKLNFKIELGSIDEYHIIIFKIKIVELNTHGLLLINKWCVWMTFFNFILSQHSHFYYIYGSYHGTIYYLNIMPKTENIELPQIA